MNSPAFNLNDREAACTCQGALHPDAIIGLQLFNQKLFYEAHEAFETAWRIERKPIRELYRGILQVGAGYYQIQRGKYAGGIAFFSSCRKWLDPFPQTCRGIQVGQLRKDYQLVEQVLINWDPEKIDSFDQSLFKQIQYVL
ncbi:MAG: DUF309 domain-containing protein [Anaerolineae bacterium]|nr:DUF309 domain-containing protein [Anaerolineae bacterium]